MNLQCLNGEWKPERQDLKLIPDCLRNNLYSLMQQSSLIFLIDVISNLWTAVFERRQLRGIQHLPMHERLQRSEMSVGNGSLCNDKDEVQWRIFLLRNSWFACLQVELSKRNQFRVWARRSLCLLVWNGWIFTEECSKMRLWWVFYEAHLSIKA